MFRGTLTLDRSQRTVSGAMKTRTTITNFSQSIYIIQ